MTQTGTINIEEFNKTERDSVTRKEFEDFAQSIVSHPFRPQNTSENREPTKAELEQRFKLTRR